MVQEQVPDELVRTALDEILAWDELARSPSLQNFLRYVIDAKLDGRGASIKAYSIAVDVFDRPPDFDPQVDPIVRVQAGRLRKLLFQFYARGLNSVPIRIQLPVGGYVPDITPFDRVAKEEHSAAKAIGVGHRASTKLWVVAGSLFAALVASATGVLVFTLLQAVPSSVGPPERPSILIEAFENLTGDAVLDERIAEMGRHVAAELTRFDFVAVREPELRGLGSMASRPDFRLTGISRTSDGHTEITAFLVSGTSEDVIWSMTTVPGSGPNAEDIFNTAARSMAGRLGDVRGPLHGSARAWADSHAVEDDLLSGYLCRVRFERAWDSSEPARSGGALGCANSLIESDPDDAIGLAIQSVLNARPALEAPNLGAEREVALFDMIRSARRAAELAPESSFVRRQLGRVLTLGGDYAAAMQAFERSLDLNPANFDTRAEIARLLLAQGDYQRARRMAEAILAESTVSPPWFQMVPMIDGFRFADYEEAIFNAVTVMETDWELGIVVAVAAGALASRSDISQRYLPDVLASPRLQGVGILPWIERFYPDPDVIYRLRLGLTMAGVDRKALDRPFEPPQAGS